VAWRRRATHLFPLRRKVEAKREACGLVEEERRQGADLDRVLVEGLGGLDQVPGQLARWMMLISDVVALGLGLLLLGGLFVIVVEVLVLGDEQQVREQEHVALCTHQPTSLLAHTEQEVHLAS
jgi:hypothetical protein